MQYREVLKNIKPYIPGKLKSGAIKLASNENPLGSSPMALQAIRKYLDKISLYPDGSCVELKAKLAKKYKLKPENIILGNGSDEIFLFIAGLLIEPGDQMVTSECTFSEYEFAVRLFGGEPVFAPIHDGRYQLKKIAEKVNNQTKVIFLANPNNPTGTYFSESELTWLLDNISPDILVVVDEAYCEYVQAKDYPDSVKLLAKYKNLLVTRTFSKIYGLAGLRVGLALGDSELIANLNKTREPFNVNSVAQIAAAAALSDKVFIMKSLKNNLTGKKYLYKELTKLGLKYYQTEANFVFVYLNMDCMQAFEKLMALGVTVRPMKSFGVNNAIRVTIGTPVQNKKFIDLLKKIIK